MFGSAYRGLVSLLLGASMLTPALAAAPVAMKQEAAANVDAGKKAFGKCASCHGTEKGGPAKVGPNLYDVVGGPKGHMAGFAYSDAIKKTGGEWSYDNLYAFLKNPKAYAPGTKMAYAGSKSPKERADLPAPVDSVEEGDGLAVEGRLVDAAADRRIEVRREPHVAEGEAG